MSSISSSASTKVFPVRGYSPATSGVTIVSGVGVLEISLMSSNKLSRFAMSLVKLPLLEQHAPDDSSEDDELDVRVDEDDDDELLDATDEADDVERDSS